MKRVPYTQCVAVIIILIFALIINLFILNNPLYYGLIIGLAATFIVGIINDYSAKTLITLHIQG